MADGNQHSFHLPPIGTSRLQPGEIIVDLFAGGGGASEALRQALGRDPDIAINHNANANAITMVRDMAEAVALRLAAQPASITGEVVKIGDDEEGQPRIVIHTTREAIRDYPGWLLFKRVQVSEQPASAGEGVGDA